MKNSIKSYELQECVTPEAAALLKSYAVTRLQHALYMCVRMCVGACVCVHVCVCELPVTA